ncbi:MAG: hypothetical protein JST10_11165 [Bacteroidetes bacterium]|nr:hypothetical protein [Bacteroidota bacterium]MBS1633120.1 hypothetical protein [Bacteroidota bacterium]
MPDFFYLLTKWWKQISILVLISLIVVGVIVFIKPSKYLSVATSVSASTVASDKSRIFSDNIESLYSNLGSPDDLDMMVGAGQLDTIFLAVSDQFNLYDHYKLKDSLELARIKSARLLKLNSEIQKSGYGELKIKVWDTDKNLAPQLANALMDQIQILFQNIQSISNTTTLNNLKAGMKKIRDSIQAILNPVTQKTDTSGLGVLKNQLQKYQQLIGEYQLMVDNKPPSLLVVEKARPSLKPDKPKRLEILSATLVLSFLFALWVALALEKRKTTGK